MQGPEGGEGVPWPVRMVGLGSWSLSALRTRLSGPGGAGPAGLADKAKARTGNHGAGSKVERREIREEKTDGQGAFVLGDKEAGLRRVLP